MQNINNSTYNAFRNKKTGVGQNQTNYKSSEILIKNKSNLMQSNINSLRSTNYDNIQGK